MKFWIMLVGANMSLQMIAALTESDRTGAGVCGLALVVSIWTYKHFDDKPLAR